MAPAFGSTMARRLNQSRVSAVLQVEPDCNININNICERLGRAWLPNSRVLKGSAVLIEIFERSPFHGKDSNTLKES